MSLKTGLCLCNWILEANMVQGVTKRYLTLRSWRTRNFPILRRVEREWVAQSLGCILNSPCRPVFSPECHFHLNSLDCPPLQPTCRLSLHSLERLRHGDDLIPDKKGVRIARVPENSASFIPFQVATATAVPLCEQTTCYSFPFFRTVHLLHQMENALEAESKNLCCKDKGISH